MPLPCEVYAAANGLVINPVGFKILVCELRRRYPRWGCVRRVVFDLGRRRVEAGSSRASVHGAWRPQWRTGERHVEKGDDYHRGRAYLTQRGLGRRSRSTPSRSSEVVSSCPLVQMLTDGGSRAVQVILFLHVSQAVVVPLLVVGPVRRPRDRVSDEAGWAGLSLIARTVWSR